MAVRRETRGTPVPPGADEVEAFLRGNPGFLAERPDLLREMTPPTRFGAGEPIADFQAAMIRGLRRDLADLSQTSVDLLSLTRTNLTRQQRTHSAALAIAAAETPSAFHRVLTRDWPRILDVDAVCLVLEDPAADAVHEGPSGISRVPTGFVDRLFAAGPRDLGRGGGRVLLTPERTGGNPLFGATLRPIRSDALARLDDPYTWETGGALPRRLPVGILGLGSFRPLVFEPSQATDLLQFLTRLLAVVLSRWCAPTP